MVAPLQKTDSSLLMNCSFLNWPAFVEVHLRFCRMGSPRTVHSAKEFETSSRGPFIYPILFHPISPIQFQYSQAWSPWKKMLPHQHRNRVTHPWHLEIFRASARSFWLRFIPLRCWYIDNEQRYGVSEAIISSRISSYAKIFLNPCHRLSLLLDRRKVWACRFLHRFQRRLAQVLAVDSL